MTDYDLRISVGELELFAEWVETNPTTREAIAAALPVSGAAARWGDELYFDVPVDCPPEDAQATVPEGAIAYWPQGNSLCLFWGPTPASDGSEPRAASPVNVIAVMTDVTPLTDLDGGATVRIEAVD